MTTDIATQKTQEREHLPSSLVPHDKNECERNQDKSDVLDQSGRHEQRNAPERSDLAGAGMPPAPLETRQ
jgi:hypothetical protein